MINKEKLEKMINEVIKKDNILLSRPDPERTVIKEATFNTFLERVNEEKLAFFVVSASRSERGSKHSRGNMSAADDLENFLTNLNLSFQKVDGGYTEKIKKIDPETEKPMRDEEGEEVYEIDPETNQPKQFFAEEVSYLVFGNVPHYGDMKNAITDTMELFEIAKKACLVDEENPQDSFSFGYPSKNTITGEEGMFIALYRPTAIAPGPSHAFTEWGGPWYSIQDFGKAEGAYTSVRGGKSTFVEKKLQEAKMISVSSVKEGMIKQAKIQYWTKMKNRIERR